VKLECRRASPTPLHMRGSFHLFLFSLPPLGVSVMLPVGRFFRRQVNVVMGINHGWDCRKAKNLAWTLLSVKLEKFITWTDK